jgi:hypothetical protein
MITRHVVAGLVLALVSLVNVPAVQADHLERIEKLVCQLQTDAHKLNVEIVSQYRMVPQFGCLSADAGQIMALASQVREPIRCGDAAQLNQILCQIERLSRHVQDELDNVDDLPWHSYAGHRACRVNTGRAYRLAEDVEDDAIDLRAAARHLPAPPLSTYRLRPSNSPGNIPADRHEHGAEPIPPGYGAPLYYGSGNRSAVNVPSPRPIGGRPASGFGNAGIRIFIDN